MVGRELAAGHGLQVVPGHLAGGRGGRRRCRQRVAAGLGQRLLARVADVGAPALAHEHAALLLLPRHPHVAGRPRHAVDGLEAEVLGRQRDARRVAARAQPPARVGDGQPLHVGGQAHAHAVQLQVGGGRAPMVVLEVEPQAQRSGAALQVERQVDVVLELRDVAARQVGVDGAGPAAPVAGVGKQRLAGSGAQREAVAPRGGWRGVHAHVVRAQAVAQHDVHVGELERGRVALLVDPAHRAVAQHQFLLAEEPVERGRLVGAGNRGARRQVEAADVHVAGLVPPHQQAGVLDVELGQARRHHEQRARGQRRGHPRQAQRLGAGGVAQHHVAQVQRGDPARRPHADRTDAHRNPYRAAGMPFHVGAPILDVRQNPPMKSQPGEHEQAQQ